MPEETEIETQELQDAIEEMHEERKEREKQEKQTAWTRYIALSTAILAVFAAIGALQSGSLVNEAMITQLRASDTWNEYQADRQKDHLYTLQANSLLDSGAKPIAAGRKPADAPAALSPGARLAEYLAQIDKEGSKETELSKEAKSLEKLSEVQMDRHERFARSVALIQVAIALSAVAALGKNRPIWYGSLAVGAVGIALFIFGFL